mgnify:CR=1 FL=1
MDAVPLTAVVTGAAGAIGREVAQLLLADEWDVVGIDVNAGSECDVQWVEADVSDVGALAETADSLGSVDLLVNTHAVWPPGTPAITIKDDQWKALVGSNLKGTFLSCRAFYPNLLQARGTVVNLASTTAHQAFLDHAHYCAVNRAIVGLTEVLALEWSSGGIRVFALGLGPVRTSALESAWEENPGREKEVLSVLPQGRLPHPKEVARAILGLTDDRFAYLNGTSVVLDGGLAAAGGY